MQSCWIDYDERRMPASRPQQQADDERMPKCQDEMSTDDRMRDARMLVPRGKRKDCWRRCIRSLLGWERELGRCCCFALKYDLLHNLFTELLFFTEECTHVLDLPLTIFR